jgi:mRNA interferase MazF
MVITQGDIYWIELDEPEGSEPGFKHPHVIVQNNLFNRSKIKTVLVCPLTTNLKRAGAPGNVLLNPKESNLPKESVVNVSAFHGRQESAGRVCRDTFIKTND